MKNRFLLAAAVALIGTSSIVASPQPAHAADPTPRFESPFKCGTTRTATNQSWAHRTPWELDFVTPKGIRVYASASGTVTTAGWQPNNGYGNLVVVDHGDGWTTWYAHLDTINTRAGDQVRRGQFIGTTGNTSATYPNLGPHLHFEVRRGWEYPASIQPVVFHGKQFAYPRGAVRSANC